MYFPQNWEFGSALSKLRNLGGGGLEHLKSNPPLGTENNQLILARHFLYNWANFIYDKIYSLAL
jgi:hypothetical protein